MKFAPKSEKEIAEENLFQPGEYDFEIIAAEETVSKNSGNEMIALKLKVYDADGRSTLINDYLLESVAYKLRHAAEVCGLLADYNAGQLDGEDFHGKVGRCKVSITKDKTGQYPDRNGVADYVIAKVSDAGATKKSPRRQLASAAPDLDDDIPF